MNNKILSNIFLVVLMLIALSFLGCEIHDNEEISIIPIPEKMEIGSGEFVISSDTKIWFESSDEEIKGIGDYLSDMLNNASGFKLTTNTYTNKSFEAGANSITLSLSDADKSLGDEGYSLSILRDKITIKAIKPAGLFYAVQTLRQLLPVEIENSAPTEQSIKWAIPSIDIKDSPSYRWRGILLDVARTFFDKEYIKKFIDYMAMHKLNNFHIHLTDNQGWRLEIDKYPKLIEVGAYRPETRINGIRNVIGKYDGVPEGRFYTKEDIREIIVYAKSRFINVIPEIDMPGHAISALASYPEVSCTGVTFDVEKDYDTFNAGIPFKVATDWRSYPDDFCPGKEVTFEFLENILSEVIELFPSEYIHIGGDECRKNHWRTCPDCQARMVAEGLDNVEELQNYFVNRIEKFVISKGRKVIGWDEILEGGKLSPGTTIMSWRGIVGGVEASKHGHDVIMTPGTHLYLDHYQGDPEFEPLAIGGYTTLKKTYSFNPIPEELTKEEAKHIIGAQGNVWTDHFFSSSAIEYMAFPRISALSEVVWSPIELRDWEDFSKRMEKQYKRYDILGINYSKTAVTAIPYSIKTNSLDNALMISFRAQTNRLEIRYTLNNSKPNAKSTLFKDSFKIYRTTVVTAGVFKNNKLFGKIVSRKFIVNKAVNKSVELLQVPTKKSIIDGYDNLTNGMIGTGVFNSGLWAQFEGDDVNVVIDLEKITPIKKIATNFMQFTGAKAFAPLSVEFATSMDGENYEVVAKIDNDLPEEEHEPTIKTFEYELNQNKKARYVRVIAKNRAVVPDWHPRWSGRKAWLFVDEIVIE